MMKKIRNLLLILCFVVGIGVFTSCDEERTSEPEYVDYVEQTKLNIDVTASHNFFGEDGVALATLVRCVDGDTAVFIANGTEFTARFLGVDTPESTGQIEKWGKTASKFTASKLMNAVSIVVQSDGGAAKLDSNGTRYLTYVWYKSTEGADYRLLNLELVQEGLSYGKPANATRYEDELISAQTQAMQQNLRLFGDSIDENYYYGDAKEVTVKYILENSKELLDGNVKVRFDCTVVRVDGMYIYVQDKDLETDTIYSLLLYTGYNFSSNKMAVANRLSVCGTVQEYQGNIQISGLKDSGTKNPDNVQFIQDDYEIFATPITAEELKNATSSMERLFVELANIKVTKLWTTQDGTSQGAITITGTIGNQTVTVRTAVLRVNYVIVEEDYFKDKTITVKGFIETFNNTKQIKLVSVDDVTFVE